MVHPPTPKESPTSTSGRRVYPLHTLASLTGGQLLGDPDTQVAGVAIHHSAVIAGDIYVAIRGTHADGHDYIPLAAQRGAAAAVISSPSRLESLPAIVVSDTRASAAVLAAHFQGDPSKEMTLLAVTGTNGKTTITWLISKVLESAGLPCLRIGTLGIELDKHFHEDSLTSPDALTVQRSLRRALDAGTSHVALEASSHALDQQRLAALQLDVAIFTNLSRDHLDYHGTMEHYFSAKASLFSLLKMSSKPCRTAIVNIDDRSGRRLVDSLRDADLRLITYGTASEADLRIAGVTHTPGATAFALAFGGAAYSVHTPAIGLHNAYNVAATFLGCWAAGLPPGDIISLLAAQPLAPGRLEPVGDDDFHIYVDYAHTPDALANALMALRATTRGRLWVVFGCGGDRDPGKRPEMLQVATKNADVVVVTSDNPRREDPDTIIRDIASAGPPPDHVDPDRRAAIRYAVTTMSAGDVLLLAGKGHEDYQILGTTKVPFSDQEEARSALRQRRLSANKLPTA